MCQVFINTCLVKLCVHSVSVTFITFLTCMPFSLEYCFVICSVNMSGIVIAVDGGALILAFRKQRQVDLYEFKASPVYIASFSIARAT